jgi:hypothetical protein
MTVRFQRGRSTWGLTPAVSAMPERSVAVPPGV